MLHSTPKLLALVLAAALAVSACSDDPETVGGPGTNDAGQDAAEDDAGTDDAGSEDDAGTDQDSGSEDDAGDQDTGDEAPLWVPDFAYLVPDEGRGISVNIVSGYIGKIQNNQALSEEMTDQEIADLEAQILTEETRDKMVNGWDCGDATEANGVGWVFEARVLTDAEANEHEQITTNISGCVLEDSTEPDAARVQEIIQHLDDVRADHFAPR